MGSSPNMTGLSLLTQGDWAEGTTAHNGGTMAAPLVLMGDTCNRIRVRTPGGGGGPHGEMVHPSDPPNPSLSCPTPSNLHKTSRESAAEGQLTAHCDVCAVFNLQNLSETSTENCRVKIKSKVFLVFDAKRHFCCAWIYKRDIRIHRKTVKINTNL